MGHAVDWVADFGRVAIGDTARYAAIQDMEQVRRGTWPGLFKCPDLEPRIAGTPGNRSDEAKIEEGPAMLMLHIFSTSSQRSEQRRQLIRQYHPLLSVPMEYRHLVEVKFILGRLRPEAAKQESTDTVPESTLEAEMSAYGDLVRLDGLMDGENMNQGKTLAWIRWVGQDGARQSQWVM
jgi:hypothetical protein